ncbi:LysM peptidoglycan-binding domain-containing protein [Methylobacter sp. S3L5C]|nr:LysM peptidoglycan-binding domain-containing protein [Methylobacter sp. S3L5C]UOA08674.1 LysM peptidoglycan-binding domain-containing protein [Methylobacter sp. S3L5C]
MTRVNFNRSVNFLLISISLIVTGCSDTPKEPLVVNDQMPVKSTQNDGYVYHPTLRKHKFKTASTHKDTVWERLLSLYSLPDIKNPRIDRELYWYLEHPASLAIIQQRAEPYLHHILDEIEAKNMPGELALLPVVESAFVPDAYSKADASGLWQFVPATGKEYGLQQNAWYDGRRDIYASTKAATTYLKELSENFDGDWLLALASYNCGKGRVRKSIERNEYLNLPTDYWSLDLPQETDDYVPRLLAIARLFAHADEYNIHLQHIPNKPYFEVVDIKSPLDLHKAAKLANTPLYAFLKLNPGFNRASTAPEGPHRLLVPAAQAQAFKNNLATLPYSERVAIKQYNEKRTTEPRFQDKDQEQVQTAQLGGDKTRTNLAQYKVRSGDNLSAIANRNNTTVQSLRQVNHLTSNTVNSGMRLQMPSEAKSNSTPLLASISKPKATSTQVYTVKKGDTFFNISQRFSVTPKDIANWNSATLKTALIPGRKLTINSINPQLASVSSSIRLISYKVGQGDSLTQISRKFNVSVADLRKSNAATLVKGLRPGQTLKIIVDNNQSSS